jgi:hypothetical protein
VTTTYTFLYFFTEERLHNQQTDYHPVTWNECMEMINHNRIGNHKLIDKGGIISTHYSTEPVYIYCCHWVTTTVINYELSPGYIYLDRSSKKLQSSLCEISHCNYQDNKCLLSEGTVVWHGNKTEVCIFKEVTTITGTNHGLTWLSDDHTMELDFRESQWQPKQVCNGSRDELMLIHSDEGLYVENTTEIMGFNFTGHNRNITWGQDINMITQALAGYVNSVTNSLAAQLKNQSKNTFWDLVQHLCKHEKLSTRLITKLIITDPTHSMRELLQDDYLYAKAITDKEIAVYGCVEVTNYTFNTNTIEKCSAYIPITVHDWLVDDYKTTAELFMNPLNNVLYKEVPIKNCQGLQHTFFRLNGTLRKWDWHTMTVDEVHNIDSQTLKSIMHHKLNYTDEKIHLYRERIGYFTLADIQTESGLLQDFVSTVQRERLQLRKVGIWPDTGSVSNETSIKFSLGGIGLFNLISSGIDKALKIWGICCNILVTLLTIRLITKVCAVAVSASKEHQNTPLVNTIEHWPSAKGYTTSTDSNEDKLLIDKPQVTYGSHRSDRAETRYIGKQPHAALKTELITVFTLRIILNLIWILACIIIFLSSISTVLFGTIALKLERILYRLVTISMMNLEFLLARLRHHLKTKGNKQRSTYTRKEYQIAKAAVDYISY